MSVTARRKAKESAWIIIRELSEAFRHSSLAEDFVAILGLTKLAKKYRSLTDDILTLRKKAEGLWKDLLELLE